MNFKEPAPFDLASYLSMKAFTSDMERSYSFSSPVINVTTRIARSLFGVGSSRCGVADASFELGLSSPRLTAVTT